MHFSSLLALAAPLLVSAIQFTDPTANATLTKGSKYDLTWSTVDTDPTNFSIYLVNFFNWPPSYTALAYNVESTAGEYEVTIPCDVENSWGYQLNAINGTNVYVIYAQTDKFYIGGGSCTDPTPSSPTCAAATVTVTVSTTLKSFGNSTKTLAPSVTAVPLPGKCPDTIGWGSSGYNYPVTLPSVPHGPGDVDSPTVTKGPAAGFPSKNAFAPVSTIYTTVYKDLSEIIASGECAC
ncbi:Ser-Thr-rich glycosyl-phosphatidyl-inositol-anchored membrane family-domain-containing protein [Podospora appendiculata]|uniref:Ser-Thr-rich glycosyl-phosphatidyl-inositol-anchored membrane family-domain-containing protein n=1 Tax=Podospora appendiculata TaxID=314037 RepID=A0AAE1CH88_9PEZI|nr:Ser-Thr-rich glycosyl-phosphatidyl-inositol-anchored membrane family-domain-containing protein [Podospora appendiculata]